MAISPNGRFLAYPLFFADAMQIADTENREIVGTIEVGRQPASF